jgi:hypothetical protein
MWPYRKPLDPYARVVSRKVTRRRTGLGASRRARSLMGVYYYLINVHLMGVHLTGVHLMSVYLTDINLMGVYLQSPSSKSWRYQSTSSKFRINFAHLAYRI